MCSFKRRKLIVLKKKIQVKQEEMYFLASMLGREHPYVIACSQAIDSLLNQYDKIKYMKRIS